MTRNTHAAGRHLTRKTSGPFAKTYACPFCSFYARVMKREWSLAAAGGAASRVAAHIEHEHAERAFAD